MYSQKIFKNLHIPVLNCSHLKIFPVIQFIDLIVYILQPTFIQNKWLSADGFNKIYPESCLSHAQRIPLPLSGCSRRLMYHKEEEGICHCQQNIFITMTNLTICISHLFFYNDNKAHTLYITFSSSKHITMNSLTIKKITVYISHSHCQNKVVISHWINPLTYRIFCHALWAQLLCQCCIQLQNRNHK